MNSLVFYLALALIAWVIWGPRVGIPATIGALILAVLIGISRIYLGAHYFSDVVAGFIAGLAWLLIVSAGFDAGTWVEQLALGPAGGAPAAGRPGLTARVRSASRPGPESRSAPGHDHRQCARPDRHRDRRRAGDAAIGLDQTLRIRPDSDLAGLGPEDMPARALAEVLLEHRLPAREQGRDRTGGADDDHVEQPVIAADPAARLDHRQHLAEVGDEDLGRLHRARERRRW